MSGWLGSWGALYTLAFLPGLMNESEVMSNSIMHYHYNDINVASDARVAAGVCALHSDCGAQLGRILVEQRGDQ